MRGNPSSSCLPNWEIDFPALRLQRKHPPSRVPGFLTSDLGASRPPKSCKPIPRHVCVRGRMHTRIHTHAHTRHGSRSSGNPESLSLRSRSLKCRPRPAGPSSEVGGLPEPWALGGAASSSRHRPAPSGAHLRIPGRTLLGPLCGASLPRASVSAVIAPGAPRAAGIPFPAPRTGQPSRPSP